MSDLISMKAHPNTSSYHSASVITDDSSPCPLCSVKVKEADRVIWQYQQGFCPNVSMVLEEWNELKPGEINTMHSQLLNNKVFHHSPAKLVNMSTISMHTSNMSTQLFRCSMWLSCESTVEEFPNAQWFGIQKIPSCIYDLPKTWIILLHQHPDF
jgi:hypothetical protein